MLWLWSNYLRQIEFLCQKIFFINRKYSNAALIGFCGIQKQNEEWQTLMGIY